MLNIPGSLSVGAAYYVCAVKQQVNTVHTVLHTMVLQNLGYCTNKPLNLFKSP